MARLIKETRSKLSKFNNATVCLMNHVSSTFSVYYFVENICQVSSLFSKSYEKVSKEMLHQVNNSLLLCGLKLHVFRILLFNFVEIFVSWFIVI